MMRTMGRKAKRDQSIKYMAVNVKLPEDLLPKIKILVGNKMAEKGIYVSQQDFLAELITTQITKLSEKNNK